MYVPGGATVTVIICPKINRTQNVVLQLKSYTYLVSELTFSSSAGWILGLKRCMIIPILCCAKTDPDLLRFNF